MEQRISLVTLGVRDVAAARRFYEALGWRPAFAEESVAFFQVGGMVFSLFGRDALAEDANLPAAGSGFSGIALAYNVRSPDEVAATLAEAERAGAKILKPAQQAFWGGTTGYFADPDGHVWEVAHNPHWVIADDGSIRIP